jgi:hypothetical protein
MEATLLVARKVLLLVSPLYRIKSLDTHRHNLYTSKLPTIWTRTYTQGVTLEIRKQQT